MTELKKHEIVVRYIAEYRPNISSVYTPAAIAQRLRWDWWEHGYGPEPKIIDITVDGEVFE